MQITVCRNYVLKNSGHIANSTTQPCVVLYGKDDLGVG